MREKYPAIIEFCTHWPDAPMLQQTFRALEKSYNDGNDACIDAAKGLVECACRTLISELDDPSNPIKGWKNSPIKNSHPTMSNWVTATILLLKLSVDKNSPFNKLISQYHKIAEELSNFRNEHGPLSHGKYGFLSVLTNYHRDGALLAANSIIGFLHYSYLSIDPDIINTHEPYSFFDRNNNLIDEFSFFDKLSIDEVTNTINVKIVLSKDNIYELSLTPSELLFGVDRQIYKEILNSVTTLKISDKEDNDYN